MTIEYMKIGAFAPIIKLHGDTRHYEREGRRGEERGERKTEHTSPCPCVVLEAYIRMGCRILPYSLSLSLFLGLSLDYVVYLSKYHLVQRCTQMILLYCHHSSLYILGATPTASHTYHLVCPGSDQ